VLGATGAQGGGLIKAILRDQECKDSAEFRARALSRFPLSDKSQLLKQRIPVAEVDVLDEGALCQAISGDYGLFCVSFYDQMKPAEELLQAEHMAYAARDAGIQHVIWSTLEDTRETLERRKVTLPTLLSTYKVPHFDVKAEADRYFMVANVPTTYLVTSFYWDNFLTKPSLRPQKSQKVDAEWKLCLPMGNKRLAGIAAEDIGKCALAIFRQPQKYINHRVGIMSEALTGEEIAKKMSIVLERCIRYDASQPPDFNSYRSQMQPDAAEYGNMFEYFYECESEVLQMRNADETRELNAELLSFEEWLLKNKSQLESIF
jgi:uncharacterized protein YbjT (DUF2867 family)